MMASSRTWVWTWRKAGAPSSPELAERAGRDDDPVADPADLDQDLAGAVPASVTGRGRRPAASRSSAARAPRSPAPCGSARRPRKPAARQVADGQGQGVGPVGRAGRLGQAEQDLDHALHLLLGRRAVAGDGLLDLVGAVLRPPGMPASAAAARASPLAWPTDMAVRALTWNSTRSTTTTSGRSSAISSAQVGQQHAQPGAESGRRRGVVRWPAATARSWPPSRDHRAVAAPGQPGIDAEGEHPFDASSRRSMAVVDARRRRAAGRQVRRSGMSTTAGRSG